MAHICGKQLPIPFFLFIYSTQKSTRQTRSDSLSGISIKFLTCSQTRILSAVAPKLGTAFTSRLHSRTRHPRHPHSRVLHLHSPLLRLRHHPHHLVPLPAISREIQPLQLPH